jgi:hypothetical protein
MLERAADVRAVVDPGLRVSRVVVAVVVVVVIVAVVVFAVAEIRTARAGWARGVAEVPPALASRWAPAAASEAESESAAAAEV